TTNQISEATEDLSSDELRCGSLQVIDRAGDRGSTKSVIDIHDRYPARTAVQHSEQGRHTTKAGAVPDAGWHGNHGGIHQSPYHARKRAFHPGHDDEHAGTEKSRVLGKQTVESGDSDIVESVDAVPHDFCRDGSLFGDWQIGGAGRGDAHSAAPPLR